MKSPPCVRLGPVALQILAYLTTHRNAQDTVEGIAEWWLLEQRIRHAITEVKSGLAELVGQGLIVQSTGRDGRMRYRLDPRKRRTVAQHLESNTPEPSAVPACRARRNDR